MSRREQLVDDAAEVAALLEHQDTDDAQLVDDLGDVDEDDTPVPTRTQVRAAALLCSRATSGSDLDDLAGALGVRHAVEPAERWLNALSRAAAEPARPPMAQALLEHLVPAAQESVTVVTIGDELGPCLAPAGTLPVEANEDAAVVYPNPIDDPDEIVPIWLCEQGQHEACDGYACPCCASGQCPAYPTPLPEPQALVDARLLDEHDQGPCGACGLTPAEHDGLAVMHFPQPVDVPTGPQPCEVCGVNVTAQKIAETGRARHPWHPEAS